MGISERTLLHLAFFEALTKSDEGSAEWRATSAGLVTLRLFDAWVSEGPSVVAADSWSLRAVRDAINDIEPTNMARALLGGVVDAMELASRVRMATVAPRLLAYGRALQFDARWALAADVYRTVIAHAHPVEEADVVIGANLQLGACLRVLTQWDEAGAAFSTAGRVAELSGDVMNVLRSRIAEGKLAMDRGNLPRAEVIFEDAINHASHRGLEEVKATALHDRAAVAHLRGDYELGVRLAYQALEWTKDPAERDRVLNDIAASFFELGLRSAARDAHLILAATAQQQYMRWMAVINLLEIATIDRSEPVFEQYRRELADASLPASLAVHYHYYVGVGYQMFGQRDLARASLTRTVDIAAAHGINQMLLKAENALQQLEDGGVIIIASAPGEMSREVGQVATAIHEMRRLAGVAG